jgi:hypothetical protein
MDPQHYQKDRFCMQCHRVFTAVLSNCVFCPVLFAGIDANTFFLAQSGLCFQPGADSVPFPQEKFDSDPYLV